MRRVLGAAAIVLVFAACTSSGTPTASVSSRPSASPPSTISPGVPPLPSPSPDTATSSYGLLIAGGKVEMIDDAGRVAASAAVHPGAPITCADGQPAAIAPGVSASADAVYFLDGGTALRKLTFDGTTSDVMALSSSATVGNSFAVSPNDGRIAVVQETFSSAAIAEDLYVEDLGSGAGRVDLYSTTTANNSSGRVLWPVGWHNGQLVLAVMAACSADASHLSPFEWHYSSSTTGNRIATITRDCLGDGGSGILGRWPSPSGVACVGARFPTIYRLDGHQVASIDAWAAQANVEITGGEVSPSGGRLLVEYGNRTDVIRLSPFNGGWSSTNGHNVCLWIDEDHLLASDSMITFVAQNPDGRAVSIATPLAQSGTCAGRYPGGL